MKRDPMEVTEQLARGNAAFLRQGLELIRNLDDEQFQDAPAPFSRGGIGAHFRHILDHYDAFLAGLSSGRVDYDRRERDANLEERRDVADAKIDSILRALARLGGAEADRPLEVAMDCGAGPGAPHVWSPSSVARELQFLVSHTVHHYAVIAAIARLFGVEPGSDFGVAPSTLKYERDAGLCAR